MQKPNDGGWGWEGQAGREKLDYSNPAHRKTQVPIVVSTGASIQNGHLKDD